MLLRELKAIKDPSIFLRTCPVHKQDRSTCPVRHMGERNTDPLDFPNYNRAVKVALGYFIQKSGKSLAVTEQQLGWTRGNFNSLFKNSAMRTDTLLKICTVFDLDVGKVFELAFQIAEP